ncbi:MAG: phosphoenolpyruvate--protein phosphotransferase [Victivallaceae bacterium]|nr:phosphoenolpyruvate--protein phosphotransferase [Victivallaceae bacterium]
MAKTESKEKIYHGIGASPGIAIGKVLLIKQHSTSYIKPPDVKITPEEIEAEINKFESALDKTRQDLEELQKRVQNKLQAHEASIFDAHLLIVDDQMLLHEVEDSIRNQLSPAECAFFRIMERYITAISVMQDDYIKERVADIKDVASRVMANLKETSRPVLDYLDDMRIIIAHDLTPSDTVLLDRQKVQAFAIESGSNTSHTAILARSMQIPAVVNIKGNITDEVENGEEIIVDGFIGTIIVCPGDKTREAYKLKAREEGRFYIDLIRESRLRPETLDGFTIQLASNIETLDDIQTAKKYGTSGVGLFRTEYMYMGRQDLPTEEAQVATFTTLIEEMKGEPVVVRTLDIGGDKYCENLSLRQEANPFLGLRAIRLCLQECRDVFRTQLRALLRAGIKGNLKIMLPMVSCVEEVVEVRKIIEELKGELFKEKLPFNRDIEVGVMIETPGAALLADHLAKMVDFFSIGTNDLIQYTIAIDRDNERVSYLYEPTHPAILHLIKKVVDAAKQNRIWVSICGQMAGSPQYVPLLLGMGVHELSMVPMSLGAVRRIIRKLKMHEAEVAAEKALQCSNARDALNISLELLNKISPEVTDLAFRGL